MCAYSYVGQRLTSVILSHLIFFLRQGLLMNLGLTSSDRLDASDRCPSMGPVHLLQLWGYRCVLLCLSFTWVWCIIKKIVIAWRALY